MYRIIIVMLIYHRHKPTDPNLVRLHTGVAKQFIKVSAIVVAIIIWSCLMPLHIKEIRKRRIYATHVSTKRFYKLDSAFGFLNPILYTKLITTLGDAVV
jgi:hypothetical protein